MLVSGSVRLLQRVFFFWGCGGDLSEDHAALKRYVCFSWMLPSNSWCCIVAWVFRDFSLVCHTISLFFFFPETKQVYIKNFPNDWEEDAWDFPTWL